MKFELSDYPGFVATVKRVGFHGEFYAFIEDEHGACVVQTRHFSGKGAMRAAMDELDRLFEHYVVTHKLVRNGGK
jgi:hypothetical protein